MLEKRQFFSFNLGILLGNWEKKEDILDWELDRILDSGDRDKRP